MSTSADSVKLGIKSIDEIPVEMFSFSGNKDNSVGNYVSKSVCTEVPKESKKAK